MNIGYIFDLTDIMSEGDLHIPYLSDLYYSKMKKEELSVPKIVEVRDGVMDNIHTKVDKHLFFFIIKNEKDTLKALSTCISSIQANKQFFNAENYAIHVMCNIVNDDGFTIADYEKSMTCLTNNSVGVYTWLLDKYDFNADRRISDVHRAHAIARMIWEITQHKEISDTLLQMTQTTKEPLPIYNLFGDAAVFFDADGRTKAVRNYYSYKNLQHLLNLPDAALNEYIMANVLPFANDQKELDKRLDATADDFLKSQSVPIEASVITEKTQGLLIKSDDKDTEYLVDARDNKLVFINDLANANGWQLANMDTFLSDYQAKVGMDQEQQELVSEDFLKELYYDKYIVHERNDFKHINNKVSASRESHIKEFEQNVEKHMGGFLNQQEGGTYPWLQVPLTKEVTDQHHTSIDYGLAFMDYLESGEGNGLIDKAVGMGDIFFTRIKESLEKEEKERLNKYEEKKKYIEEKYLPQKDKEISKAEEDFQKADARIKQCRAEKRQWEFQLSQWFDGDAEKKMTARTKAVIAFACGILAAFLWLLLSKTIVGGIFDEPSDPYLTFERILFFGLIVAGIVVALIIVNNAKRRLEEAEKDLADARQHKRTLMDRCVKDMIEVTQFNYDHLLAYHGLKTIIELIDFTKWKREDLISFRKALFKLMLRYLLEAGNDIQKTPINDDNTFELFDAEVDTLLFGPEGNRRNVPYCFAQEGFSMTEAFNEFKNNKVRFDTTRGYFNFTSQQYSLGELSKLDAEIIPCMRDHAGTGIQYTPLREASVLPADVSDVEMDDIHQGQCGDCYFMATLAAIAQRKPEYIIGKNGMVEELGDDHKYFRVKFYNKDGNRVSVDIDNRFWNEDNHPKYADKGTSKTNPSAYDPWVMAVEKAWAKVNGGGYDNIVGARSDGEEVERQVEYSFAVTGKSAFYCQTKNVDGDKLRKMMMKHFIDDKLPITLYSVNEKEGKLADPNIVYFHAYALRSANPDGTFDIFNPWNSHAADEDVRGKHYEKVDITFIKDNFCVVVFFGIKESDFDSFERDLQPVNIEDEVTKGVKRVLNHSFDKLGLEMSTFDLLLTQEWMETVLNHTNYLFSRNRIKDPRGVEEAETHLVFLEGGLNEECEEANRKMLNYLRVHLPGNYVLQDLLRRDDDKLMLTVIKLSPHYAQRNF